MSEWLGQILAGLLGVLAPAPEPALAGYVEGRFAALAPEVAGVIASVAVAEGARVAPGDLLATLETSGAQLQVAQAEAQRAEAGSVLDDLLSGARPEEIEAYEAAVKALRAELGQAQDELRRAQALFDRAAISEAQFTARASAVEVVASRLAEAEARLALADLPPRADQVEAQRQRVAAAEAQLALARWRLEQHRLVARSAGRVERLLRQEGEQAGPGAPVLTLLPDGAVHVVFFVAHDQRQRYAPGRRLALSCEGCPEGLTAEVTALAAHPEFTPPVIYSEAQRQQLSWRAEATLTDAAALAPGQLVSLRALDAADTDAGD